MPLSNSNVNVNPLLSGFAQDYAANNGTLVARELFPTQVVPSVKAKFAKYGKANLYLPDDSIDSYEGKAKRATSSAEMVAVNCVNHALTEGIDRHQNQNRETVFSQKEQKVVQGLVNKLLLREEKRVADLVKSSTNGQTLSGTGAGGTNKWSGTGGDPFAVKSAMLQNMWFEPNLMILSYDVYTALKNNPKILAKLGNGATQIVTKEILAELFEVERVLVASSRMAGEKPVKGTPSVSRIWSGICSFAYVDSEYDVPTAGKIFVENQSDTDTDGWFVTSWFDPERGIKGTDEYKVALVSDEKIVAEDCLYTVKECV